MKKFQKIDIKSNKKIGLYKGSENFIQRNIKRQLWCVGETMKTYLNYPQSTDEFVMYHQNIGGAAIRRSLVRFLKDRSGAIKQALYTYNASRKLFYLNDKPCDLDRHRIGEYSAIVDEFSVYLLDKDGSLVFNFFLSSESEGFDHDGTGGVQYNVFQLNDGANRGDNTYIAEFNSVFKEGEIPVAFFELYGYLVAKVGDLIDSSVLLRYVIIFMSCRVHSCVSMSIDDWDCFDGMR